MTNQRLNKYDWSNIPDLIRWIATDEDGQSFGYPNQPYQESFLGKGRWNNEKYVPLRLGNIGYKGDWRESLELRPELTGLAGKGCKS